MHPAVPPPNEAERLLALKRLQILDTAPESTYDDIIKMTATIFEARAATISFIDETRQWFKAKVGFDVSETSRNDSICAHTILRPECTIVMNALEDHRFSNHPAVTAGPKLRFYAGAPLLTPCGLALGTLCILDNRPREFPETQVRILRGLADQVSHLLEIRRLNQELAQSKQRFSLATEETQLGFWDWDILSGQVFYSETWKKMFGYLKSDISYKPDTWKSMIHPDDLDRTLQSFQKCFGGGSEGYEIQYRAKTQSGDYKWVLARGGCIRNKEGIPIRMSGWNLELTDKFAFESRLKEQESRMIQAEKMASLGIMAGSIAHEINNPITMIVGNAHHIKTLAEKNQLDKDELLHISEKIDSTVRRIARIVKGLRAYAKNGEKEPFQTVSVNGLINDTLVFCQGRFKSYAIELKTAPVADSILTECRPVQVSQVLLNLLNNAFDAVSGAQEKWISIEVTESDQDVFLSVIDSGNGITPEIQEKIMEPFFTTKSIENGSGLGLSVSKSIIEAHNGKLFLDIQSPRTKFTIQIPKAQKQLVKR